MHINSKTHTPVKGKVSEFFKDPKRIIKDVKKSRSDSKMAETSDSVETLKVRLILEKKFDGKVLSILQKLPNAPKILDPTSEESLKLAVDIIKKIAKKFNVEVQKVGLRSRIVLLYAPVEAFENFFNVELHYYSYETTIKNGPHNLRVLGHDHNAYVPNELHGIVHSIIGLRDVPLDPQVPSDLRDRLNIPNRPMPAALGQTSKWMSAHYNFPKGFNGSGQELAIISCGGGFSQAEFNDFFESAGFPKMPPINIVSIDKVTNAPGESWLYDYEVATDCLIALCAAPGIKITVYFCMGVLSSFMNAIDYIIEQGEDGPDVISYSWGKGESDCEDDIEGVNRILEEAAIDYKKTIFCASGDFGSTNNPIGYKRRDELNVVFPSSSPWVTSCGGTMFVRDTEDILEEKVWNSIFLYGVTYQNASGGGFSKYNSRPDYQLNNLPDVVPSGYINDDWIEGAKNEEEEKQMLIDRFKPYRGVPDISGHASLTPGGFGYWIYFQGKNWLTGGTSAVAPLWGALTACLNEALGKNIGFFNPYLYKMMGSDAFNPVVQGHNGLIEENTHWESGAPWNPCTGLGTPNGENILKWLKTYGDLDSKD